VRGADAESFDESYVVTRDAAALDELHVALTRRRAHESLRHRWILLANGLLRRRSAAINFLSVATIKGMTRGSSRVARLYV
jgi:hypothetical protein